MGPALRFGHAGTMEKTLKEQVARYRHGRTDRAFRDRLVCALTLAGERARRLDGTLESLHMKDLLRKSQFLSLWFKYSENNRAGHDVVIFYEELAQNRADLLRSDFDSPYQRLTGELREYIRETQQLPMFYSERFR